MDFVKSKRLTFILLSAMMCITVIAAAIFFSGEKTAYAGVSRIAVVTDKAFDEEISGQFYVVGNVLHERINNGNKIKGAIVFDAEQTGRSASIVSDVFAADLSDIGLDDCLSGEVSLVFSKLNGEFYVVFGLTQAYHSIDDSHCSTIGFYDNGGKISVKVANRVQGEQTAVKDVFATFDYGETLTVGFTVKTDGKLYLSVNGVNYINYDNQTPCFGEGYFGFAQSAVSGVKITSANVYSAFYDSPTNAEVKENFDNGEFDASRIFVNNNESAVGYYKPEGISCEDGVLKFNNITQYGFVSTCYEFSNFQMTFDITHLQRNFEYDANGNVTTPASQFFGISIGAPQMNSSHYAITEAVFVYFAPTYVNGNADKVVCVLLDNYNVALQTTLEGEYNFWANSNAYDFNGKEKAINFKVEMIDGVLTCSFKWAGESENKYRTIVSKDIGYTPLGYVQIHGQGYLATDIVKNDSLTCSNFYLDNLAVINKDAPSAEGSNTVDPPFVSNIIERSKDYDYVDTWNNKIKTIEAVADEGCGASVGGYGFIALAALLCVFTMRFMIRRRKNEK